MVPPTPATGIGSPPLTAKGRTTRERIVAAATTLMLRQGVSATGLDQVLAQAGAGKSQLYHYFSGKDALVSAVIEHAAGAVLAAQEPHLSQLESWAGIDAWCRMILETSRSHGCELGCPLGTLAAELAASDDHARDLLAAAFQRWQDHLRLGLRTMRDRGDLDAGSDVDALATATMASLQGGLLLAKTARSPEPLRIALDAAYAHLRAHAT